MPDVLLDPPAAAQKRRVVFVVGSGRSGTSTMAGALATLGMRVPQPEVVADDTNPKGFSEPQWAVDWHTELLRRSRVQVSDARPHAWFEAGKLANDDALRSQLHDWLEGQFADHRELVVKDPRLAWFLGLWRAAALRCDAAPGYVTMLRPVTEVVGSKEAYYANKRAGEVSRTAAWVNMMLHTERATRGSARAFVRYGDMLTDWTVPIARVGEAFDLDAVTGASANAVRRVHDFIDPNLRRIQITWDDIDVPAALQEVAEETWQALDRLAEPEGDTPEVHARLDAARDAYADLYAEAEALADSTAVAARREGADSGAGTPPGKGLVPVGDADGRGMTDRIPHGVRAMVPASARRGIRKALGRERPDHG